jgi:hypothetical protein
MSDLQASVLHLYTDDGISRLQIQPAGADANLKFENMDTSDVHDVFISKLTVEGGVNVADEMISLAAADVAETLRATTAEETISSFTASELANEIGRAVAEETRIETVVANNKAAQEASNVAVTTVLSDLIYTEQARATTAETVNQAAIQAEEDRAQLAESVISDAVTTEQSRAQVSEQIVTISIANETARATAQEAVLASSIAVETSRASAVEATLSAATNQLSLDLIAEANRATAEEADVDTKISVASNRAVGAEASMRIRALAAERFLQSQITYITNNVDPVALDSLTEIVTNFNSVDTSLIHRLSTMEGFMKLTFDLESMYPLKVTDMKQVSIEQVDAAPIAADAGTPSYCMTGGWGFINSPTITSDKINWYFHGQDATSDVTLEYYSGFYARVVLKSVASLPFFSLYTKPKNDGTDAGSWYGSRRTFVIPAGTVLNNDDEVLMYTGADLPATYPNIPHIQLELEPSTSNGSDDNTQELLSIAFSTNSAAAKNAVNLCLKNFIYSDGKHTNITLSAPAPVALSTAVIEISQTPGNYPNELWSSITTGPDGTGSVVWQQGAERYVGGGALSGLAVTVPKDVQLYFNAYDSYGDSWDGSLYTLELDGVLLINNNGLSPDDNDYSGRLESSEGFIVNST